MERGIDLMILVPGARCGWRREEWKARTCSNSRPNVNGRVGSETEILRVDVAIVFEK